MLALPCLFTPLAGIERIDVDENNLCKYDRDVLELPEDVYRNYWGRIIVKDGIDTKLSGTLMNLFDYNPYWMDEYYCDLTEEQKPYFRKAVIETSNVLTKDNAESIEEEVSIDTGNHLTEKKSVSTDTSNLLTEEKFKESFYSVFNHY